MARDYRVALDLLRAAAGRTGMEEYRALAEGLQAIAYSGLGDAGAARRLLSTFLERPNLRPENLLALANRLEAAGSGEGARRLLTRALEIDGGNQAALARLIELDLSLNRVDALPAHVEQFVRMRRPSPEILRVVRHKLGSDLLLFSGAAPAALAAVDQAMARADGKMRATF